MKKALVSILCLTSVSAFAQNIPGTPGAVQSSTTSLSDTRKALREAGLSFVVDSYAVMARDSKKRDFRGVDIIVDAPLTYKLTDKDSFRLTPEFTYSKVHESGKENPGKADFVMVEGRYKRDKILVQADHGINGSAEVRAVYLTSAAQRTSSNAHGFGSVRLNAGRTWGKFTLLSTLRQDVFERKGHLEKDHETPVRTTRFYLSPSYSINDSWGVALDTFYNRTTLANGRTSQKYYLAPSVSYTITSDLSAAAIVEFDPIARNNDGRRGLVSAPTKNANYMLNLTATVF